MADIWEWIQAIWWGQISLPIGGIVTVVCAVALMIVLRYVLWSAFVDWRGESSFIRVGEAPKIYGSVAKRKEYYVRDLEWHDELRVTTLMYREVTGEEETDRLAKYKPAWCPLKPTEIEKNYISHEHMPRWDYRAHPEQVMECALIEGLVLKRKAKVAERPKIDLKDRIGRALSRVGAGLMTGFVSWLVLWITQNAYDRYELTMPYWFWLIAVTPLVFVVIGGIVLASAWPVVSYAWRRYDRAHPFFSETEGHIKDCLVPIEAKEQEVLVVGARIKGQEEWRDVTLAELDLLELLHKMGRLELDPEIKLTDENGRPRRKKITPASIMSARSDLRGFEDLLRRLTTSEIKNEDYERQLDSAVQHLAEVGAHKLETVARLAKEVHGKIEELFPYLADYFGGRIASDEDEHSIDLRGLRKVVGILPEIQRLVSSAIELRAGAPKLHRGLMSRLKKRLTRERSADEDTGNE